MKLLARPRPYMYESLSNYIKRVAEANYCSQSWIRELWKISSYMTSAKVNCNITDQTFNAIKYSINISDEEISIIDINQFGIDLWKERTCNHLGIKRDKFVNEKYTKYCVTCLNDKSYHRHHWQLKDVLVCLEHNSILIEKCESCGLDISVDDLIKGFCNKCGFNYKDAANIEIDEDVIIQSQVHLYKSFGIECSNTTIKKQTKQTTRREVKFYLYLYNFLYNSIIDNFKYCKILNEPEIIRIRFYDNKLQAAASAEKIINDLPDYICRFLDDLYFAAEFGNSSCIAKLSEYAFYPQNILKDFNTNLFSKAIHYKLLYECINNYFKKQECIESFKYRIRSILREEQYIYICELYSIFGIYEGDSLEEIFRTISKYEVDTFRNDNKELNLISTEDLYEFINSLSDLIEVVDNLDENHISIRELYDSMHNRKKSINYAIIFNLIFQNKIPLYSRKFKSYHVTKIFVERGYLNTFSPVSNRTLSKASESADNDI